MSERDEVAEGLTNIQGQIMETGHQLQDQLVELGQLSVIANELSRLNENLEELNEKLEG